MENTGLIKPNSTFSFAVTADNADMRIDKYITQQFPHYSRSFFLQLIEQGCIALNGTPINKQSTRIKPDDTITVQFPPKRTIEPGTMAGKTLGIEIVHEHEHFLILYKPDNVLVHPPGNASTAITLIDWLVHNYTEIKDVGFVDRPGIVHRLDKNTSGILIIPRTNYAHSIFGSLFRERSIEKKYYAIVQGHPESTGKIDQPIGRDPITRTKMVAGEKFAKRTKMRDAITHYKVLEYFEDCSLLEVKLITGRTHQIRVHCSAIGHPLVGDPVYGKKSKLIKRQALHAYSLSFEFGGDTYKFCKDVPEDFEQLIKNVRKIKDN